MKVRHTESKMLEVKKVNLWEVDVLGYTPKETKVEESSAERVLFHFNQIFGKEQKT
jgi:hypothetical protein